MVSLENNFAQVSQLVGHQVLLLCGQEDILDTDEYESDDCVKLVVFDDLINADKKYKQRLQTILLMVDIIRFIQST